VAKARDIPGLAPELPFRDAASLAVGTRAAEVWDHEHGVLDTGKIEGVHDMRVATRRLRAVMEIFAPCFPKKRHREALRDVKGIADVLGERRDPDVMIGRLREVADELTSEDRPGIESLIEQLEAGQTDANERVGRALDEARNGKLPERLELLAAEVRS
jgi:CHAD domain-containing protein